MYDILSKLIVKLEAHIAELEHRINMNISISFKSPSTDKSNQKRRRYDGMVDVDGDFLQHYKVIVFHDWWRYYLKFRFTPINSVLTTTCKHGIAAIDTIMAALAQVSCILWGLANE